MAIISNVTVMVVLSTIGEPHKSFSILDTFCNWLEVFMWSSIDNGGNLVICDWPYW